jgi:LysM domain-containing protein
MEPQATETTPRPDPIARVLAVAALIVAAIVVVVIVSDSVGGSGDGGGGGAGGGRAGHSEPHEKYYVVQPGDTFGGIAEKQGIPIARLEALNPKLDTQLLPQKGCVNLVPEGCKVLAGGG